MREFYVGHEGKLFGRVVVLDDGSITYAGFFKQQVRELVENLARYDKVKITPEYIYALPQRLYGHNWAREILEERERPDEWR